MRSENILGSVTSPPRTIRSVAVLVRRVDYGEADRIVTLLTESHGLVALMARGARKSTKRFAGALEPFGVIDAELSLGRGEVGRLVGARLVRGFPALLKSLSAMEQLGRALELVRVATPPRESDADLIATVIRLFEVVQEGAEPQAARAAFELRYLSLLGLSPRVEACSRCDRAPRPGQSALFDPAVGAIVCRACGGGPMRLGASVRERMAASVLGGWSDELTRWSDEDVRAAIEATDAFVVRHVATSRVAGRKRGRG